MESLMPLDSVILGKIPARDIPKVFNEHQKLRGIIFEYLKNNHSYKDWAINWINYSYPHYDVKRLYDGTAITDEERNYFVDCIINENDSLFLSRAFNLTFNTLLNEKLLDYIVVNDMYQYKSFIKLFADMLLGAEEYNKKYLKMFVLSLLKNNKMNDFIMFDNTYMRKDNAYFSRVPLLTQEYLFNSIPGFSDDYKLGVIV